MHPKSRLIICRTSYKHVQGIFLYDELFYKIDVNVDKIVKLNKMTDNL